VSRGGDRAGARARAVAAQARVCTARRADQACARRLGLPGGAAARAADGRAGGQAGGARARRGGGGGDAARAR
jgi:hypothetical protein